MYHVLNYSKNIESFNKTKSELVVNQTINEELSSQIFRITDDIKAMVSSVKGGNSSSNSFKNHKAIHGNDDLKNPKFEMLSALGDLSSVADQKISKMNAVLKKVGLESLNHVSKQYTQTPKFFEASYTASPYSSSGNMTDHISSQIANVKQKLGDISYLESIMSHIPFGTPVSSFRFASGYGFRFHPIFMTRKFHAGIDLVAPRHSSVSATADGTVVTAEHSSSYGNYVVIAHGNGLQTLYAHLSAIKVFRGEKVTAGSTIGRQGNTGHSTGEHVHYEVIKNGNNVDPTRFIKMQKNV